MDSSHNSQTNCSLDSKQLRLRQRYVMEYHLVTAVAMDREQEEEYHVTMTCQDSGLPVLTSSMLFIVQVKLLKHEALLCERMDAWMKK